MKAVRLKVNSAVTVTELKPKRRLFWSPVSGFNKAVLGRLFTVCN